MPRMRTYEAFACRLGAGLVTMALALLPALSLSAQTQATIQANLVNGTTGAPGRAESVTLYELTSGMDPVAFLDDVSGTFVLDGFEIHGQGPFLLQVTSSGVNYNETVNFRGGSELQTTVTVYETTADWEDIEIVTARFLIRREHDRLRVDKLYVVENRTDPKKTFYDPEGSLRFSLPSGVEGYTVSASSSSGMPVPQSATLVSGASVYATQTALKPGTTDIAISYELDYASESYHLDEKAHYPITELLALVAPADIEVDAQGWEDLGTEPQGRFSVFRKADVGTGTDITLELSGGSEHAADLTSASDEGSSSNVQVTTLPDPTLPQKWIVVLLMGAALAYGILASLTSVLSKPRNKDR